MADELAPARRLRQAEAADHGAIFTLQRASFVDEARLYGTPHVPALDETLEALTERLSRSTSWVAEVDGRIVGAVSLRSYRLGGPDIERLMVAPDMRGQGIASVLLAVAEDHARSLGQERVQLIVGDLAEANRAIYEHLGWRHVSTEPLEAFPDVIVHTMAKALG